LTLVDPSGILRDVEFKTEGSWIDVERNMAGYCC